MGMLDCMTARRGDATAGMAADLAAGVAGRLAAALERIAHARRALMQDIATRAGLSALQAEILRHVHASGPTSGSALAQEFGVTTPTVSDAIAALRHKGFVEQRPGVDARTRSVHLTPSGLQVASRVDADLAPFRQACAEAGPAGVTAALDVIHGLWREGVLSVDRSCATCRHHLAGPTPSGHCDLLGVALTPETLRVDCPDHAVA